AGEVVFLDAALEALTDGDAGDFDLLTGLEPLDRDVVTDLRALLGAEVLVAELDQVAERRGAGLFQVAFLRPRELALLDRTEGELDGLLAVALGLADRGDFAGTGFDDGDGEQGAGHLEDLVHAELFAEDRRRQIPRGGSRCRRRRGASRGAEASRPFLARAAGCGSGAWSV